LRGVHFVLDFPGLELLADACRRDAAFRARFSTEEACQRWFAAVRWPDGRLVCDRCGARARWVVEPRLMRCTRCRRRTSLTAGTLLHGTKKPLRTWFEAAYLFVQRGANARTLQRRVGLTYKVAWAWAQKLRAALARHVIPAGAEPESRRLLDAARVRGERARRPSPEVPQPCACSKLLRQDWGWPNEPQEEREVERESIRRFLRGGPAPRYEVPEDAPPTADAFATWELLGTYWGSVTEKHLRAYLDEVAFRRNHRRTPIGERFLVLARAFAEVGPRTYRQMTARAPAPGGPLSIFSWRSGA
jgi:transposase-like protein